MPTVNVWFVVCLIFNLTFDNVKVHEQQFVFHVQEKRFFFRPAE